MSPAPALTGLLLAALVISFGTAWAFQRGANDFNVFYEAWKLVLEGRIADIYRVSPDRFLYAPGFAWLLSPVALLPRGIALAIWCLAKAAVIGLLIRAFGQRLVRAEPLVAAGTCAWGVVLLARPLLIDFQYGQVNVLILGACVWALLRHFSSDKDPVSDAVAWALLAFAAVAKVFPLPLLIVPFVAVAGIPSRKLWIERAGVVAGLLLILAPHPELLPAWKDALLAKGLPLESHNQSFAAFLHHYFSGNPVHVIAAGGDRLFHFGWGVFTREQIANLSTGWTLVSGGILLGWLLAAGAAAPLGWLSVSIGMLVLPSHLVWKPYLLTALPLAMIAVTRWQRLWPALLVLGLVLNFSGFDVLGLNAAAALESASIFLWIQISYIYLIKSNR